MPRYYFDLRDANGLVVDEEGLELGDVQGAQEEAARIIGDMARDALSAPAVAPVQQMAIEVRDDLGPVMHIRFSFEIDRKN
jgi:hypothetical protein